MGEILVMEALEKQALGQMWHREFLWAQISWFDSETTIVQSVNELEKVEIALYDTITDIIGITGESHHECLNRIRVDGANTGFLKGESRNNTATVKGYKQKLQGLGATVTYYGGSCPVQVECEIKAQKEIHHLYFRARNGDWTCAISQTLQGAIDAEDAEQAELFMGGGDDTGGHMLPDQYFPIVVSAVELFLHQNRITLG
jgi:hypothetical protein